MMIESVPGILKTNWKAPARRAKKLRKQIRRVGRNYRTLCYNKTNVAIASTSKKNGIWNVPAIMRVTEAGPRIEELTANIW